MQKGKTSYSVYTNKAAEAEYSDVIHLYSSSISTFQWQNQNMQPLATHPFYQITDFIILHMVFIDSPILILHILTLHRIDIDFSDLIILIFTSISTEVSYFVLPSTPNYQ